MAWHGIQGHDRIVERFRRSLRKSRLASTFLFIGPSGIGKKTFAVRMAQALLCDQHAETEFEPCLTCSSCQQIALASHPDFDVVEKPADRSFIPINLFIGDREHRMQEGLCHRISLKPASGKRRVAIVDDADCLNQEGANCLLKTLEEPPPRSVLILIGTSEQRQLPTIRSRCQIVRFSPLPADFVADQLVSRDLCTVDQAETVAGLADGSVDRAVELADSQLQEMRSQLWAFLGNGPVKSIDLAKNLAQFVDAAGKDATERRQRLRNAIGLLMTFFRQVLFTEITGKPSRDQELNESVRRFLGVETNREAILGRIDRCLEALGQIDANANVSNLIECCVDEMLNVAPSVSLVHRPKPRITTVRAP